MAGAAHCHILGYLIDIVEQNHTDVALLEVHGYAFYAIFEFYKFVGTDVIEAIDVCDTIAHVEHGAYFLESNLGVDVFELLFQYLRYLAGIYHCMRIACCWGLLEDITPAQFINLRRSCFNWLLTEASSLSEFTVTVNPPIRAGSTV